LLPPLLLLLQDDGSYAGFDAEEFTSRSGGKAEAVRDIKVGHNI
jgi:phosphoserine phosphatase